MIIYVAELPVEIPLPLIITFLIYCYCWIFLTPLIMRFFGGLVGIAYLFTMLILGPIIVRFSVWIYKKYN